MLASEMAEASPNSHVIDDPMAGFVFPEKLFARNPWLDASCQGVPDVGDGHVVQAEKRFFEGEDAEHQVEIAQPLEVEPSCRTVRVVATVSSSRSSCAALSGNRGRKPPASQRACGVIPVSLCMRRW